MASSTHKRLQPDSDDDKLDALAIFKTQDNFARYLIIQSKKEDKPVTSLSPFVIENQIEAAIGTPKSVKKLKNGTLLVETTRKQQTENLLKMSTFFILPVEVSEHKSMNSSKGIIRDPILKNESKDNMKEYLENQGVTHFKRFKIKRNHEFVNTNTLVNFQHSSSPKVTENLLSNYSSRNVCTKSPSVFQLSKVWPP